MEDTVDVNTPAMVVDFAASWRDLDEETVEILIEDMIATGG